MPNNVETKMWLLSRNGTQLTDKQVEEFFSQFIGIDPEPKSGKDPRYFDFNAIIPQPDNIWHGSVGGKAENNLKEIEELGGLDAVKQVYKDGNDFPLDKSPCLTDEQIVQFGMVNGLDWNREHWQTKWNSYYC